MNELKFSTKYIFSLGKTIIEGMQEAYKLIVQTPIKDLVSGNPLIKGIWDIITEALNIGDISIFVLMLGMGMSLWVTIGIIKFFKSVVM